MDYHERPSTTMVIDTVDLLDRPRGTAVRREALERGQNFRVAHLFLFNIRRELLVQQLAATRERHPLAWGSSVAAYLFAGETYGDAIRRRAVQELGREIETIELVGATRMHDVGSEKFIGLFHATDNGPFRIDEKHIAKIEFVQIEEIARMLESGERVFTPTFQHLFAFYLRTVPLIE